MHPQRVFLLYVVSNSGKRYRDCMLPCIEAQIELSSTFIYDQKMSPSGSSGRNSHLSQGGRMTMMPMHRRTGRGGEGGCSPPPNFGQLRFFGQREKIWAKPVFIDVSILFNYLKTWILTWSRRNNPVTLQWLPSMWWRYFTYLQHFFVGHYTALH